MPIYQPVFSDTSLQQQATEVCGTDLECLFDMAATGRRDIGQVSVEVEQEIEEILQLQVPGNNRQVLLFSFITLYLLL